MPLKGRFDASERGPGTGTQSSGFEPSTKNSLQTASEFVKILPPFGVLSADYDTSGSLSASDQQWVEMGVIVIYVRALVSFEEVHYPIGYWCRVGLINGFGKPLGQDG